MKVVVVGAGVIGCAIAYELASRGARVQLVDMRGAGQGATRASAGILAPRIEGHIPALLTLGLQSLALYDEFILRVSKDAGRSIEYGRTGTLQVARAEGEAAALRAQAGELGRAAVSHALLDGDSVRRMEPSLSGVLTAGLSIPEHGYVRVPSLIAALGAAGRRWGVESLEAAVARIDPDSAGAQVGLTLGSGDRLHADAAVLCAGSWSGRVAMPEPPVPVRPIRGQLVHLWLDRPLLTRVVWGDGCYLVPWNDGSLLVGATTEDVGFDERSTEEGIHRLKEAAFELLPAAREASVAEVRVGLRPATSDELPLIGASPTMRGVYHASGHYRSGVLLAPLTAGLLADLMMDGRRGPALDLVRPDRFLL